MSEKLTAIAQVGGIYCNICSITIRDKKDFDNHYKTHSRDIQYACAICKKDFTVYTNLRGHCYSSHVINYTFKCEQCPSIFKKQFYLTQHIKNVHKFTFKCQPPCNMKFSSQKELMVHQIIHRTEPSLNCKTCNIHLPTLDACESHMMEQHVLTKYTCPICSETFTNKPEASKHVTVHFDDVTLDPEIKLEDTQDECSIDFLGGILCNICSATLKNKQEFDNHFFSDHAKEPLVYACVICSKGFESYDLFNGHCYDHVAREKYKCDTCNLCFIRPSTLVAHKMSCTGSIQLVFSCNKCTYSCNNSRHLINHKREAHNEIESYKCLVIGCGKKFDTGRDLAVHKMSHTTLKTWCRGCGLKFEQLTSCIDHLEVHKKSTYTCTLCDADYIEKHNFTKHILKHYETTLHVCNQCGKTFTAKRRLIEHNRTHSETKPHVCEYCHKGFAKMYAYKQHLNIHLQRKPYQCSVCKKTFASHANMCKHLRKYHKIDPKTKQPLDNNNKTMNNKNKKTTEINNKKLNNKNENVANNLKETENSNMNDVASTETLEQINMHYTILRMKEDRINDIIEVEPNKDINDNKIEIIIFQDEITSLKDEEVEIAVKTDIVNDDVELNGSPSMESVSSADSFHDNITSSGFMPGDFYISDSVHSESYTYPLQNWSNTFPAEYGPDLIENPYLPHINPALTTCKDDEDLLSNIHLPPLQQFDSEDLNGLNIKWDSRFFAKLQFDIPF